MSHPAAGGMSYQDPLGKGGRFMKDVRELREYERTDFDTPVLFSGYRSDQHQGAMMQNFSDGGLCFQSPEYLRPGSRVCVKTLNYRSISTYKVRWCNRMDSPDGTWFGIGLQCER